MSDWFAEAMANGGPGVCDAEIKALAPIDRNIAILKGYEICGELVEDAPSAGDFPYSRWYRGLVVIKQGKQERLASWAKNNDKSLHLLGEIPGGIDLSRVETGGWGIILKDHNLSSVGRTLAQAICHAYVAFKESKQRKPE